MKTLLLTICFILTLVVNGLCDCTVMVAGKKAVAGCNPASNEVGSRTEQASNQTIAPGAIQCYPVSADCSGTLRYPSIMHYSTGADNVKIGIFTRSGAPSSGSALVGNWSGYISSGSSDGWKTGGDKLTGSVTNAANYYLCLCGGTGGFDFYYAASGSTYYYSTTDCGSPPSTLDLSWTEGSNRTLSAYVEIE